MESSNDKNLENINEVPVGNAEETVADQVAEDDTRQEADEQETNEQPKATAEQEEETNNEPEPTMRVQQEEVEESAEDQIEALKKDVAEAKDKHLRLYSEFENFRRRTSKEKLDMIKTASEGLMRDILPLLDDFDRAAKSLAGDEDKAPLQEGLSIIQNKFVKVLEQKGLKSMDASIGESFDTELHEAITQIPAPEENLKGKIVDVIEQGYYLGEKVIRFAKVVIGA